MGNKSIWVRAIVFFVVYGLLVLAQGLWVNWMLGEVRGTELMTLLSLEVHQMGILYAVLALVLPSQACLGEKQTLRFTHQGEMFTTCLIMSLIVPLVIGDYFLAMARVGLMEHVYIAALAVTYLGAFSIKRIQLSQGEEPADGNFWKFKLIEID